MKLVPIASLLLALPATAGTASFDGHPEGIIDHSFTEGGITFYDLDNTLQPVGSAWFIAEQADGNLAGMPGFSSPMCLGSMGWSGGSGASFGRTKSFWMSIAQESDKATLELFCFGSYGGNTVSLEAYDGTTLVGTDTVALSGGFGSIEHHTLQIDGPTFNHLRLVGNGPTDGGVFFGLVDDVTIATGVFETNCFGDASQGACPCSNFGQTDNGCENSASTGGAHLSATGNVAPDSVVLRSSGELPSASSIFLQGTTLIAPLPFGDGLRCASGVLKRLATKSASGGAVSYPTGSELAITQRSAQLGDPIASGSVRHYQVYYRDPSTTFCAAGGTYNITNSLTVHW